MIADVDAGCNVGTAAAVVDVSLRVVKLKYDDDSTVEGVRSTAANGTIGVLRVSGRQLRAEQQVAAAAAWRRRDASRRLATYTQADFNAACSYFETS